MEAKAQRGCFRVEGFWSKIRHQKLGRKRLICSGYSKKRKNTYCMCHYLGSDQTASITTFQQTLLLPATLSKSLFLPSNEERIVSSKSTPMFPALETGKLRIARGRCQLLQHGCPSLRFFCSCPLSCEFRSVQRVCLGKRCWVTMGNGFVFQDLEKHGGKWQIRISIA